mgnify:CR=1 FL=1
MYIYNKYSYSGTICVGNSEVCDNNMMIPMLMFSSMTKFQAEVVPQPKPQAPTNGLHSRHIIYTTLWNLYFGPKLDQISLDEFFIAIF